MEKIQTNGITVSVLSYEDVMRITGLGRTTVWRLSQAGILKLRQITPGRVGFLSDDVEEFIRSRSLYKAV